MWTAEFWHISESSRKLKQYEMNNQNEKGIEKS